MEVGWEDAGVAHSGVMAMAAPGPSRGTGTEELVAQALRMADELERRAGMTPPAHRHVQHGATKGAARGQERAGGGVRGGNGDGSGHGARTVSYSTTTSTTSHVSQAGATTASTTSAQRTQRTQRTQRLRVDPHHQPASPTRRDRSDTEPTDTTTGGLLTPQPHGRGTPEGADDDGFAESPPTRSLARGRGVAPILAAGPGGGPGPAPAAPPLATPRTVLRAVHREDAAGQGAAYGGGGGGGTGGWRPTYDRALLRGVQEVAGDVGAGGGNSGGGGDNSGSGDHGDHGGDHSRQSLQVQHKGGGGAAGAGAGAWSQSPVHPEAQLRQHRAGNGALTSGGVSGAHSTATSTSASTAARATQYSGAAPVATASASTGTAATAHGATRGGMARSGAAGASGAAAAASPPRASGGHATDAGSHPPSGMPVVPALLSQQVKASPLLRLAHGNLKLKAQVVKLTHSLAQCEGAARTRAQGACCGRGAVRCGARRGCVMAGCAWGVHCWWCCC